jgi:hypothetical protein
MDIQIILVYCLRDDLLKAMQHREATEVKPIVAIKPARNVTSIMKWKRR